MSSLIAHAPFLDDGLVINPDSPGLTDQWRCPPVSGQNLRGGDGVPIRHRGRSTSASRTATVTAETDVALYSLSKDDFLTGLTRRLAEQAAAADDGERRAP
jgi:CRP-like cAMP-binding protein